ncbi:MAG TPA: hypothetical protein VI483_02930 [Candidatus Paceibacterota bacterium]
MANVLPKESKKKILLVQRARFIFAFSLIALAVAFISYLALMPSYLALVFGGGKFETNDQAAASTTQHAVTLREAKAAIVSLTPVLDATTTPGQILQAVFSSKPAGITIDRINYSRAKQGTIVLSGIALRTTEIEMYRTALDSSPHVESVSIPVNALVGSSDGAFTMTISGDF